MRWCCVWNQSRQLLKQTFEKFVSEGEFAYGNEEVLFCQIVSLLSVLALKLMMEYWVLLGLLQLFNPS